MFDLIIHGALLIDGTGQPPRRADVAVLGDRIAFIAHDLSQRPAREHQAADGWVLAPGFIDAHTHDDRLLLQPPPRHPKLLQGVTTVVTGNCGISLAPLIHRGPPAPLDILGTDGFVFATFADYLQAVASTPPAVNAVCLVGHSTLRVAHVADLQRAATTAEASAMRAALAGALHAGAWGLSTGLYYPPARAATADEVVQVGQPLHDAQGVLTMHLRDEADHITTAMHEALAIARRLDVPLVMSHHKLVGQANHGRSIETLALLDRAARLQPVCVDCYPYDASSTMLLPERAASAGKVLITWSKAEPAAAGRWLAELALERGLTPEATAQQLMPGGAVYFAMDEQDVQRILAHPLTMIGSDGLAHDPLAHPRLWGSFARVLGHYARDLGLFSLSTAVHKMTGLVAQRLGIPDRGVLREGAFADMVLFDAARVADCATYAEPTLAPLGIERVYVNGVLACRDGEMIDATAGRLLRRGFAPGPAPLPARGRGG